MSGTTSLCTPQILTRIADSTTFNAWKAITSGNLNSISSSAAAGNIDPSPNESSVLSTASADIVATSSCIQEQINKLGSTTNNIQSAQSAILDLNKEIEEAKAQVAIARDRVAYIRHPEQHTSFYESWFPIDRPMHVTSVPAFMGITIFLFIFALLIVFSVMGVDLQISITPRLGLTLTGIRAQFTWLSGIQFLVIAGLVYYFVIKK
jgi:hypothetical protein